MSVPDRQRLSQAKRELLERRLQGLGAAGAEAAIPKAPRDRPPRASFAQERMWFLDRLVPGSPAYNVFAATRLMGPLDTDRLAAALTAVVRRHDVLRTTFDAPEGHPRQIVGPPQAVALEQVDLSDAADPAAETRRFVEESAVQLFDLDRGPLLRLSLARLGVDDHVLLVVAHHTVFDAISIERFIGDVDAAYRSVAGGDASLPELRVQYGDYAEWQRQRLEGPVGRGQLAYWRERLKGMPAGLDLPLDHARTPLQSARGEAVWWSAPSELTVAVRGFCARERVTPFVAGLAVFATLLGRTARQEDVVVGTPLSGRIRPELDDLIGCFINTIVLRLDLSGGVTFRELVSRARATVVEATEHAEVPFEWLVQELQPERNLSQSPLAQVMFNYQRQAEGATVGAARARDFFVPPTTARLDLEVALLEGADGIEVFWNFNADLFDRPTIETWAARYGGLLAAAVAAPDTPVARLPLLTEEERRLVLHEWNPPLTDPPGSSIPAAFAETAAKHAGDVAVVSGDETATYAELDARSRAVAAALLARGLRPEDRVGVFVRPSIRLVEATLGTLQAGCAYVPLDPSLPPDRLAWILEDARPVAVVTESALLPALPAEAPPVVVVDGELPAGDGVSLVHDPRRLAYVLYTSGSTGRPKGVQVEHRSVVNFIASTRRLFDVTPADRVVAFASVGFDVSVFELFCALLKGARLVVATDEERRSTELLQALLERHAITLVDLPPAVMELLVPERLPALRIAFVGGEAFTGDFTTRWAATCRFFNGYGPTESTVTVVVKECTGVYESSPPIGRAMENHRAYVLDEWLEPVPPGVPGELYIGGAGLARGYLGRPELTAKAFVPDAFSGVPGARLYRTGDLVKWNGEGDLVFLGRVDRQLKIRGIRIEPGEVEQTLERHPAVVAAVVEPWQTPTGTRLAAYVVPGSADGARDGLAEELEAHARRSLIEAMVPSTFVFLDELPLTPSGKVDRAALPHPAPTRRRHVPPATETEHAVAGILGELLDAPEVGMSDSFFELGGHSLLAMQVVRRLRERLGVDLPVTALFTSPTVGALAQAVAERQGAEGGAAGAPLVTLRPGSGSPVVLVHPTGGGLFCYREIVDLLPPGRPVLGFEQSEPWPGTVSQLASSYLDQLAAAGVDRPAVVAGWSFGGVVAHELASLLHERSGALPEALLIDSYSSRDQLGWERPAELARIFVADIVSMTVADVPEPDMPDGDEEAFLVAALAAAHRCGALEELDLDELRRRYAIFRANAIALAQHLPAPYAGPVTLVKASHSVSTATAWRELSGTLESHVLDGDHYSIVRGDGAEEIARLLDALAARATAVAAGV